MGTKRITIADRFRIFCRAIGMEEFAMNENCLLDRAFRAGIREGQAMQKEKLIKHFARVYPSQEKPRR